MSGIYQVNGCEGFEVIVPIEGAHPGDIEAIKGILFVEELKEYNLFERWTNNNLFLFRRFYWVDGEYILRIRLLKGNHCEDEKRIVVKVTESKSGTLFIRLKEILQEIDIEKSHSKISEKQPNTSQTISEKIKNIFGDNAIDLLLYMLSDDDLLTRWRTIRILYWFKDESAIEPVYNLLETEREEIIWEEIMSFFSQFKTDKTVYCATNILKENHNPVMRIKAIDILLNIRSKNVVDILLDAAEFDPDKMVKDKAIQALQEMKVQ
jgi:hypothetical protein